MLIVRVETDSDAKFDIKSMYNLSRYMFISCVYMYFNIFKLFTVEVSMESKSGYLSATDWPLLPVSIVEYRLFCSQLEMIVYWSGT